MDKKETAINLLNHYQNEWIHRHSHFWKIFSSMLIANLIIICFPICCAEFGIIFEDIPLPSKVFPIVGICFTIISSSLLFIESSKLIELRKSINKQLTIINGVNNKKKFTPIDYYVKYINFIVSTIFFIAMIFVSIYVYNS